YLYFSFSTRRSSDLVFILIVGAFTNLFSIDNSNQQEDSQKFVQEYESLNGKNDEDGNPYYEVSIENEVEIEYSSYDELEEFLDGDRKSTRLNSSHVS